jgi:heat shock protein HslJ
MACGGAGGQRAGAFRAALRGARGIRFDGPRLTLLDGKGVALLAFEPQLLELTGTAWDVTGYNNGKQAVVSVITGTTLTLEFGAEGRVAGSAGCNRFTGTYAVTGSGVAISGVAATRKMCVDPEKVMEQESQYLQALTMGTHSRVEGGRLELRNAAGALAISATRAAPR